MAMILEPFKLKPYDLGPIFAEWTDAPRFLGNPKKDIAVDDWLDHIKAGCIERKIPKTYWDQVGRHFLGDRAKARFNELTLVMRIMQGEKKYPWTWKSFKTAMRNMCWDVEPEETESFEIESKPSGLWSIFRRSSEGTKENVPLPCVEPVQPEQTASRKLPKRSKTLWEIPTMKSFPMPRRSTTMAHIDTISSLEAASSSTSTASSSQAVSLKSTPATTPSLTPASTPGETVTTIAHAPLWLLNACGALEKLTTENPHVMSGLAAVLIAVGSLPAVPAVAAGAGGAFLASGTAHAIGSIAVGLGSWLKAQNDGQLKVVGANPMNLVDAAKS